MKFFGNIISVEFLNSVGWTIIHSLWQGAIIALLLALALIFLRRYSSRARYLIGSAALLLILFVSLITFFTSYNDETRSKISIIPVAETGTALKNIEGSTLETDSEYDFSPKSPIVQITYFFRQYFEKHLPLIVTAWLFGILIQMLRFISGFSYNLRLRVHGAKPVDQVWLERLKGLCSSTGIKKPVRFMESYLAKTPMVIGYLKPIILFPVGVIAGLPQDQVEALLLHELAHIRRGDYLINMLQSFVDIIYFFHPGVRWISSFVRSEREKCCDDMAVSVSDDSLSYAKALTNIHEHKEKSPELVMAVSVRRKHLLNRVKRLFNRPKRSSYITEAFTVSCVLFLCILLAFSMSATSIKGNKNHDNLNLTPEQLLKNIQSREFSGKPISVKFNHAPLEEVINTIVSAGKIKIFLDREIQGRVSVELRLVPWDQILDYILDVNQMELVMKNDILYVKKMDESRVEQVKEYRKSIRKKELYTGVTGDFSFKDSSLVTVLIFFAKKYDINVVIDPGCPVHKKINFEALHTKWDKALDSLLGQNGLQMDLNGNLLRIQKK